MLPFTPVTPTEGSRIVVDLPGERLMALVKRVVRFDWILAELDSTPLTKNHNYRREDLIPCHREHTTLGLIWRASQLPSPQEPPSVADKAVVRKQTTKPVRKKAKAKSRKIPKKVRLSPKNSVSGKIKKVKGKKNAIKAGGSRKRYD